MSEYSTNSTRELHEELEPVLNRTRDAPFIRGSRDEPLHTVPNDDEPWSVADVLAEMMAGAYAHGARVDVFEYRLYLMGDGGELPNVWTIHPSDGGGAIDALNLGAFRTASEVKSYLLEGTERE